MTSVLAGVLTLAAWPNPALSKRLIEVCRVLRIGAVSCRADRCGALESSFAATQVEHPAPNLPRSKGARRVVRPTRYAAAAGIRGRRRPAPSRATRSWRAGSSRNAGGPGLSDPDAARE